MSDESIQRPAASNNSLAPWLNYINTKIVKFDGSYLEQENCVGDYLFGAFKLTKNTTSFDKCKYFGCGIGFDALESFSSSDGSWFGKNVIIFGADMTSSVYVYITRKGILILGKDPTQRFDDTILTAEKEHAINFSEQHKRFCLSLHYNGLNSYLFVNSVEIYKFKAKDFEINAAPLCLGNVSKDFSADNLKKTESYGYVYGFSVDNDLCC